MTNGYPSGPMSGRGGPFDDGCQCAFCWCMPYGACHCAGDLCSGCGCCEHQHCDCYDDDPTQLVADLLRLDDAYVGTRQAHRVLLETPRNDAVRRKRAEQDDQDAWIAWCRVRDLNPYLLARDAARQVERIAELEQAISDWVKERTLTPQTALLWAWLAQELAQVAFRVHRAAWLLDGLRTDGLGLRAQRAAEEVMQTAHGLILVARGIGAAHPQLSIVCDETVRPPALPLLAEDMEDWCAT